MGIRTWAGAMPGVAALRAFRRAAMALAVCCGLGVGVGVYTFVYAKGASYLSDDAAVCANCHVMQAHYDAWAKSSHRNAAVCNSCHTPHFFIGKYATKGWNGWRHSTAFTTGWFPDTIRITPLNRYIVEESCRTCHADIVQAIDTHPAGGRTLACTRCHPGVGHLE